MSTVKTKPDDTIRAPFQPDRSGTWYAVLNNTHAKTPANLTEIAAEIRARGFKSLSRNDSRASEEHFGFSLAAEQQFADVWNRFIGRYSTKDPPIHGARMRRLVGRVVDELNAQVPA